MNNSGKLNQYIINSVLIFEEEENDPNTFAHISLSKNPYSKNYSDYDRMMMFYKLYDRFNQGLPIDDMIKIFHSYPRVYKALNRMKEKEFEGYKLSTVSITLLILLMNYKVFITSKRKRKSKIIGRSINRYNVKRVRKILKKEGYLNNGYIK